MAQSSSQRKLRWGSVVPKLDFMKSGIARGEEGGMVTNPPAAQVIWHDEQDNPQMQVSNKKLARAKRRKALAKLEKGEWMIERDTKAGIDRHGVM